VRPHLRERSGGDDKPASVEARDGSRDESLSHSYFVAKQGTTELVDRAFDSRHRRNLVGLEQDASDPRVGGIFAENEPRDAGADFFRGC
jgi:hypothetical protein